MAGSNFIQLKSLLLSDCQFGFRKRRSTKLAATLLCDSVRKGFEGGLLVGCLFLDLSKAFDTMGHSLIIEKLMLHGVSGPELAWVTDYLFNRTQTVDIDNHLSSKEVKSIRVFLRDQSLVPCYLSFISMI